MKKTFIAIISALLCLPLAAVEREDEAFPLDTTDVVWTFTEGNRVKLSSVLVPMWLSQLARLWSCCLRSNPRLQ